MKRFDHGADITVLKNPDYALRRFLDGNAHHGVRQVVGSNLLVGEEHQKRGITKRVREIRLLGVSWTNR